MVATGSIAVILSQQNSTDFNKVRNLVRDQGVGGSNPLSPTNLLFVQPGDMGYRTYLRHR